MGGGITPIHPFSTASREERRGGPRNPNPFGQSVKKAKGGAKEFSECSEKRRETGEVQGQSKSTQKNNGKQ